MRISDLDAMPFEELWRIHEELTRILADKIIAAMDLPSRRETSLAISESAEDGMQWLARTIANINFAPKALNKTLDMLGLLMIIIRKQISDTKDY